MVIQKTMIRINKETAQQLKTLRITQRDTYDEIIIRMLEALKQK